MSQNEPVGINTHKSNVDSIVKQFMRKNCLIHYYKSLVTIKNTIVFDIKLVLIQPKHHFKHFQSLKVILVVVVPVTYLGRYYF